MNEKNLETVNVAEFDISIEELDAMHGGVEASTLFCVACPYSCFSTIKPE